MHPSHPKSISIGSINSIGMCPLNNDINSQSHLSSISSFSIDYDRSIYNTITNFSGSTCKPTSADSDYFDRNKSSKITRFSNIVKTYSLNNKKPLKSNDIETIKNQNNALFDTSTAINSENNIITNGQLNTLANNNETQNLKEFYSINIDENPEILFKKSDKKIEYMQNINIRYLKPPNPPSPPPIIIKHEPSKHYPVPPPLIIRQQPPVPVCRLSQEPLVIREAPPPMPEFIESKVIKVRGKLLPPPPRKVIIEKLALPPPKTQTIIIERWLPYKTDVKRRVVFQKQPDPICIKPKDVILFY